MFMSIILLLILIAIIYHIFYSSRQFALYYNEVPVVDYVYDDYDYGYGYGYDVWPYGYRIGGGGWWPRWWRGDKHRKYDGGMRPRSGGLRPRGDGIRPGGTRGLPGVYRSVDISRGVPSGGGTLRSGSSSNISGGGVPAVGAGSIGGRSGSEGSGRGR